MAVVWDITIPISDSSGLFFLSGTALYYMAIPDGEPARVDDGFAAGGYTFPHTWIAGK